MKNALPSPAPDFESSTVDAVRAALSSGELSLEDLSARRIAAHLGKTTGALYHHFANVDALLFAVARSGFVTLSEQVGARFARKGDLADVAEGFVTFGLKHPALYALMFERRYDWAGLREAGCLSGTNPGGSLLSTLVAGLRASGVEAPDTAARLLWAGLHGLVSLAASGRANTGRLGTPDAVVAKSLARELAHKLCSPVVSKEKR